MRRRPTFSVTSMSPFGRNAMLHGAASPRTYGTTRIDCAIVWNSRGASGAGSGVTNGYGPCWAATTTDEITAMAATDQTARMRPPRNAGSIAAVQRDTRGVERTGFREGGRNRQG